MTNILHVHFVFLTACLPVRLLVRTTAWPPDRATDELPGYLVVWLTECLPD